MIPKLELEEGSKVLRADCLERQSCAYTVCVRMRLFQHVRVFMFVSVFVFVCIRVCVSI